MMPLTVIQSIQWWRNGGGVACFVSRLISSATGTRDECAVRKIMSLIRDWASTK